MGPQNELTELIRRGSEGDQSAVERLLLLTYDQLRRSARGMMRAERGNHTLQATALVHEAFLRLSRGAAAIEGASRDTFFRMMAAQMRRHLIDHARRRNAGKRGGGVPMADLTDLAHVAAAGGGDGDDAEQYFVGLDRALEELAVLHPRAARVIQERVFADRTIEETAAQLAISPGTVKREFAFARAWLAQALGAR